MLHFSIRLVPLVLFLILVPIMAAPPEVFGQSRRAREKTTRPGDATREKTKTRLPNQAEDADRVRLNIAAVDPYARKRVLDAAARIDRLIESRLADNFIDPNPSATDARFVRRVYLDIIGRIPTGRQAFAFLGSKDPEKRGRLIDRLLNHPGYASHLYNYFADLLRFVDKSGPVTYTRPFGDWFKDALRENKPYDRLVYEMLTSEGKPWENPAVGYKLRDRGMPLDNLNNTIRVFLGTRIGCAQCHDHPFDHWTQKQFYELAAFEGGIRTSVPRKQLKLDLEEAKKLVSRDAENWLTRMERYNREQVFEKTAFKFRLPGDYAYDDAKPSAVVEPRVIFGEDPELERGESRREAFAKWLTSKNNPRFARTIVNRLWKRALGVGLFEPVDDIREDTAISHPELLDFLVAELQRLDFNLKEFQRIIYHTETYQRKVTYDALDPNSVYLFPGPILRRMTAEQVWDSMLTLTLKSPDGLLRPSDDAFIEALDVVPGMPASQLAEKARELVEIQTEQRERKRASSYKNIILRRASELPQPLPDGHFLRQFGQSDRQIIGDGHTDGTVPQLLTMFNGPVTHMMLEAGSVIYNEVTRAKGIGNQVKIIFLSILGRLPTHADMARASSEIRTNGNTGYGDVIWALLNTREFLFVQ